MDASDVIEQLHNQGFAIVQQLLTDQLEALRLVRTGAHCACTLFATQVLVALLPFTACAQECDTLHELALAGGRGPWGGEALASCVFETLPGQVCTADPDLRHCYSRYYAARGAWPLRAAARDVLLASHLTQLVMGILGPGAVLYNDQYIIKPGMSGTASTFGWHRDSDWCRGLPGVHYVPYISVWIALDDVDEHNGCLRIRPGSHLSRVPWAQHANGSGDSHSLAAGASEAQRDSEEGVMQPLCLKAGAAVIMRDRVEHASGPNASRHVRRAWMPQFSAGEIAVGKGSEQLVGLAIPLQPPVGEGETEGAPRD